MRKHIASHRLYIKKGYKKRKIENDNKVGSMSLLSLSLFCMST